MQLYHIKVGFLNKMMKKFFLLKQENSAIDKPQKSILVNYKPKSNLLVTFDEELTMIFKVKGST